MTAAQEAFTLPPIRGTARTLLVVFGDQLDLESPLLDELDPAHDVVLMMEVEHESRHVPSHVQRTVLFLSAMRHFAVALADRGLRVSYVTLDDPANTGSFETEIPRAAKALAPQLIRATRPGEWRVLRVLQDAATAARVPLDLREDDHGLMSLADFERWARGKRSPVMEFFYREQRRRLSLLLESDGSPRWGQWNFDADNRLSFGRTGPTPPPPRPRTTPPDAITREVLDLVARRLPDLPGSAASFAWPVTREQALEALRDFITHRLDLFGPYEDAMWTTEPFVYHSLLSPALNLKLLSPRECVNAAVAALDAGTARPQSVEAFVRQLIGWREFIRGLYWREGADYADRNALQASLPLPALFWTGATDMACLRASVGQVLDRAYGHHIQRLMVIGNFALLLGIRPREMSNWFLGMYVDGVDWVTAPNVVGMALHADGGVVGTKPYAASGKYISRMSNYCTGCRYSVEHREGPTACPFNTLYWDFLMRHRERFAANPRMVMMLKNVDRLPASEQAAIARSASNMRAGLSER